MILSSIARNGFGLPNTRAEPLASLGEPPKTPRKTNEIKSGGNIIGNRTRPFAYTFRANKQEKNLIDKAIVASGLTMREFIIRAITNKPIVVVECGGEILAELKRQGNNLNQAVRNNYYGIDTERELRSCITELKNLYRKISVATGGG